MLNKIKEYIRAAYSTGFFYIMLCNILSNVFAFFSGVILVRIVSKGEYGIYTYANNILSYFLLFTGLGMVSGTLQICCESNKEMEKMNAAYDYGVHCGLLVNLAMSILLVFYSCFAEFSIEGAGRYILLMSFLPMANIALEFIGIYFRSIYKNKEYAFVYIVKAAMFCIISIIGAFAFGAYGIILANYMAPVLSVACAYVFTDFKKRQKGHILNAQIKKEIWRLSIVSMSSNAVSQLMYLIDISVISTFIKDEEAIASYQIGMTIPAALNFIPLAIVTYIYPYFASHVNDTRWTKQKYKVLILGIGALNFGISTVLVAGAPMIIRIVFGEQYMDAVTVFRVLSISYFFQGTFRIISGNLLVTQKKLGFNLVASIMTGLVNIMGDYFLIQKWGATGVAVATLIVMIFSGALLTAYYLHVLKRKEREQECRDF